MRDFRVKLQTVDRQFAMANGGEGAGVGGGEGLETVAQLVDLVAVIHPHRDLVRQVMKESVVLADAASRAAELPRRSRFHLAAEGAARPVHAVADSQHGNPQLENLRIGLRGALFVNARRSAGQDQPARLEVANARGRQIVPHELAEDILIPDASRDELGRLPAEIEHEHALIPRRIQQTAVGGRRLIGDHFDGFPQACCQSYKSASRRRAAPGSSFPIRHDRCFRSSPSDLN